MSSQNEIVKEKFNEVISNICEILEKLKIETEIEEDEKTGLKIVTFATYVNQITSYPVLCKFNIDNSEDELYSLNGHIILSLNLNIEKIAEIRKVVNEWNKNMVLGIISINPDNNSLHYKSKIVINNVEEKTVNALVSEIAERVEKIISMAAQLLSVIEKNDYEADDIYEDAEDDASQDFHDKIDEYIKMAESDQ